MSLTITTSSKPWSHVLLDLLQRQHAMVDRLVALAQSQAALIEQGNTDLLLDLLAKRQMTIDEFTASQTQLTELTQGLDQRLDGATAAERDEIKSLIGSIGERLTQVMRRDEQDQAMLRSSRDQVKHELSSLGTTQQARTAYRPSQQSAPRFADRRG